MTDTNPQIANKRKADGSADEGRSAKRCRSLMQYDEATMTKIMASMANTLPDSVPDEAMWKLDLGKLKLVTPDGRPVEINIAPRRTIGWWDDAGSNCKLQMFFDPDDPCPLHKFLQKYLSDDLIKACAEHAPNMWTKPPRCATKKGLSEKGFETLEELAAADIRAGPGVKPELFNTPFKVKAEDNKGNSKHQVTAVTLYTLSNNNDGIPASTRVEAEHTLPDGHPLKSALINGDCDVANMNVSVADRRGASDLTSMGVLGKMSFKTPGEGGKWMVMAGTSMRLGGISMKWNQARKSFNMSMYLNGTGMTCVGLYDGGVGEAQVPSAAADVYDTMGIETTAADAYDELDAGSKSD